MNEAELLLELKKEEKILAARLDAVRRTIAVFNGSAPVAEEDDTAFLEDVEAATKNAHGNISAAIRRAVTKAVDPVRVVDIVRSVKEEIPDARYSTIGTLAASLCRAGKLKRVSKGVYRMAK